MHTVHTTPAYVLKTEPIGEANKLITLFTKDLGRIRATAQGIRLEKSKLRFAVQEFSLTNVSLVQGKGAWRVTNALVEESLFTEIKEKEKIALITRIFSLLDRLLQGEDPNEKLFQIVKNGMDYIKSREVENDQLLDIECVIVLRILNNLGYVGGNKNLNFFTISDDLSNDHLTQIKKEREIALSEINRALRESQL